MQDKPTATFGNWGLLGDALHMIHSRRARASVENPSEGVSGPPQQIEGATPSFDPDQYQHNKRKLKKAIREHYRYVPAHALIRDTCSDGHCV